MLKRLSPFTEKFQLKPSDFVFSEDPNFILGAQDCQVILTRAKSLGSFNTHLTKIPTDKATPAQQTAKVQRVAQPFAQPSNKPFTTRAAKPNTGKGNRDNVFCHKNNCLVPRWFLETKDPVTGHKRKITEWVPPRDSDRPNKFPNRVWTNPARQRGHETAAASSSSAASPTPNLPFPRQ